VKLALVAALLVIPAAFPSLASAHVGRTLPVATSFTARITGPLLGLRADVVDGDQTLWLQAPAATVVIVPGALGEPLLRFDGRGVWLNLRSPTAQSDRIDRFDLRPSADPNAKPLWHRVAAGHAYAWHEHRLHLLEPLARGLGSAGTVGPWSVPVVVDGRRLRLHGVLDYRPPGRTWAWIGAAAILAAVTTVVATRSRTALVALALAAVPLVWAIRIGRELYGRPTVPAVGYVEVAATSLVGAALVYGLVNRDEGFRIFAAFLVGFGALYQGLTMLPLLTHAIALSVLPSMVVRVGEVLVLGAGIGVIAGSVLGPLRVSEAGIDSRGAA
jgi:hypothetical protein